MPRVISEYYFSNANISVGVNGVYSKTLILLISNIFSKSKSEINLRNKKDFYSPRINTVYWGSNSLSYLGPKIWNIVPVEIKFKIKIKEWKPENCPCKFCKPYINGIGNGFI